MRYLFDSPPRLSSLCNSRDTQSTESVKKVVIAGSSSMPRQRKEEKGRRLLVGYLAEGEGEREREGEEVDARP